MNLIRKGILLVVSASLIFVLSMLFLANTIVNPAGSLTYIIGQLICFFVAPAVFFFGIAICIWAYRKRRPVERTLPVEAPQTAKTDKHDVPMPVWMVWTRRFLAISLIAWIAFVIAIFGLAAFIMFASQIAVSLVAAAFTFSKKRGIIGTAAMMFLSASVFASIVYYPLILFFGPTPFGIPELVDDWAVGRDPYVVENILLAVRSGLLFSAGLAVFATSLLGLKRFRRFETKRITKIVTVCFVLLSIAVMCFVPTGEGIVDPSVTHPWSIGGNGRHQLFSDFNTTRAYENGQWVYSLHLYNRGSENTMIIKIWAWHEAVEPLSTRVAINGTGISVSEHGILFEDGASGIMTFTTEQGHNRITLLLPDKSVNTFNW